MSFAARIQSFGARLTGSANLDIPVGMRSRIDGLSLPSEWGQVNQQSFTRFSVLPSDRGLRAYRYLGRFLGATAKPVFWAGLGLFVGGISMVNPAASIGLIGALPLLSNTFSMVRRARQRELLLRAYDHFYTGAQAYHDGRTEDADRDFRSALSILRSDTHPSRLAGNLRFRHAELTQLTDNAVTALRQP